MTITPEGFVVLTDGPTIEERDERLTTGADELVTKRGRAGSLLGNERFLLGASGALMTFGVTLIVLGWWGAAHSTLSEEQLPYMISGGLLGLALAIIGAVCLLAHWLTVLIREGREQEVARRQDQAALLEALRGLPRPNPPLEGSPNGTAGSTRRARPLRGSPRGQ